jgi:hypothetical protein
MVAWHRNLELSVLSQKRLRARPAVAVAAATAGRIALLIAQMLAQLGAEGSLDQSFF